MRLFVIYKPIIFCPTTHCFNKRKKDDKRVLLHRAALMVTYRNEDKATLCNQCKNMQAEVFQEDGDYCLDRWQESAYLKLTKKRRSINKSKTCKFIS